MMRERRRGGRPVLTLLLAAALSLIVAADISGARDFEPRTYDGACGVSGGRYDLGFPEPDSSDTDGSCEGEFANWQGAVGWAHAQIKTVRSECESVRQFLLYDATLAEWTGWVQDEYWHHAGTWDTKVGFHWDWMDSTWLWVFQGAVGKYKSGIVEAAQFADMCTTH